MVVEISNKARKQAKKLKIEKLLVGAIEKFKIDQNHPSLDFKKIQPKHLDIYSIRLNDKYRARFIKADENKIYVLTVGNFH